MRGFGGVSDDPSDATAQFSHRPVPAWPLLLPFAAAEVPPLDRLSQMDVWPFDINGPGQRSTLKWRATACS